MSGKRPGHDRGGWPPAPDPLPVPVTDAHCHLDMGRGDDPPLAVAEAVSRAAAVGVPRIVHIGCDRPGARWAVRTAHEHAAVVAGIAVHPNEAPVLAGRGELDDALAELDALAADERVLVIGETGLDHFRTGEDGWAAQEAAFRAHIELAKRHDLPLQIHDREAHADVLRVLADAGAPERVVLHCFSGDAALARECVRRGYVLSFGGAVTFGSADGLREALAVVPLDQLLVETDAPFLAPVPHRGRPCASYLVPLTVRRMAQVRQLPEERLCAALAATAARVLGTW